MYQSEDKLRDVKESLRMLETKMGAFETFQNQQQQYPHIEGFNAPDARALMMKLLTAAITVVQIIFVIANLFIHFVTPFVRTTPRIFATALLAAGFATYYYHRDYLFAMFYEVKQRANLGKS